MPQVMAVLQDEVSVAELEIHRVMEIMMIKTKLLKSKRYPCIKVIKRYKYIYIYIVVYDDLYGIYVQR